MNKIACVFLLLLVTATACKEEKEKTAPQKKPPNIIFIMADDLGYGDVGIYGQTMIKTPNIDKLAAEGMMFTQMYAGSTVCAPSRSSLMTGMHTGHTRVRGNARVPLQQGDVTFPELLQQAGYTTGLIGKWGLGEAGSTGIPNKKGFDYFYGYLNQRRAHNYYPEYLWENEQHDSLDNKVSPHPQQFANDPNDAGGFATEKKVYSADKFLEKTIQFLENNKDTSFFLYLPFTLPHANNEAKHFKQSGMEVPDPGIYRDMDWPYDQRAHAAMITYLDKQVGIIMNKLKELGLDENTLLIFTSDNGPHNEGGSDHAFFNSNGPLRGLKRDMYEGGIRIPFIARWTGTIQAGTKSDHVAASWDMLPTFCEVAGTTIPAGQDGISFLPALQNKPQQKHEYLYWEFYEQGGKQAVRMDNWKCIKLDVDKPAATTIELYDLSADLEEQHNVAAQHPDIVAKATKLMQEAHVYSADFHFVNE